MIKQKLTNKRTEKKYSQEKMAELLGISQSQYNRRENGITKITKNEWDKMAKVLNTTLESIYEPEDGIYIIENKNSNDSSLNTHNNFHQIPNHILETMRKYIEKLEEENRSLKDEIKIFKK